MCSRRTRRVEFLLSLHLMHQQDLASQFVDFLDERHIFLHESHVVISPCGEVPRQLLLEQVDASLQVGALTLVLLAHVGVDLSALDLLRHVHLIHASNAVLERQRILNESNQLVHVVAESGELGLGLSIQLSLSSNLVLLRCEFVSQLQHLLLEVSILAVEQLEVGVHAHHLILHVGDFILSRFDLSLQLLDLVVQHELELLQLLIVLLQ